MKKKSAFGTMVVVTVFLMLTACGNKTIESTSQQESASSFSDSNLLVEDNSSYDDAEHVESDNTLNEKKLSIPPKTVKKVDETPEETIDDKNTQTPGKSGKNSNNTLDTTETPETTATTERIGPSLEDDDDNSLVGFDTPDHLPKNDDEILHPVDSNDVSVIEADPE